MKVGNLKRMVVEDFDKDDQPVAEKIAFVYNPMAEQVSQAFNKNIDFDNLNQEVITFDVELTDAGTPKAKLELKNNLRTKPRGLIVIRAENLTLDGTFPTATPFITFGYTGTNLDIKHISAIPGNKRYRLTAISIG